MDSISVIIPFYNREQYFEACLRSVQRQTRPPEEIIVVDDGSRPPSRNFLARFAGQVTILTMPANQGAAAARNVGLAHARGNLVALLDSDDLWEPEKLEIQAHYMARYPACDATHTAVTAFYPDGSERQFTDKPSRLETADALQQTHVLPSALMCRAEVLRRVGGFDTNLCMSSDQELSIRLAAAGYRVDFLPFPLTRLRRTHKDRVTGSWVRIIRGDVDIVRKHWDLYEATLGPGGARRYLGNCFRKVGGIRGRALGRCLKAVGFLMGGRL
jgi:glycosyltransferase involved in cell wall biosynthesis